MQKLGWFRGLGVTEGHRKHRHLIEHIWLPFDFNKIRNYTSTLYHFPFSSYSAFYVKTGEF